MAVYRIDGYTLTLDMVEQFLRDPAPHTELTEEARERCARSRAQVDRWLMEGAPAIYGVNTGLGALKGVPVSAKDHIAWNNTIAYPHAAGFGDYLPPRLTLLALMMRANVLAQSYAAVRPALIQRLLDVVNAGVAPAVRAQGSRGLSDLGPLAQCVLAITGKEDAFAFYQGELMSAPQALRAAGLEDSFVLECKEALAMINGSTMTQAIAVDAWLRLRTLLPRCLPLLAPDRAEAIRETMDWIGGMLELENNITCDTPLLFEVENGEYEAVMGCNCSNTQVGYAMDLMSVILAELGKKAAPDRPILWQRLATLAMQVSADSIPTTGGQEDHVEFSYTAAEKASEAVTVLETMLGVSAV